MYSVVTSYKFVKINNLEEVREQLKFLCNKYNIKGTILLANEGINFTLSGILDDLEQLLVELNKVSYFKDLKYNNYTTASFIPFKKMKVRLKNEIVALKDVSLIDLDMSQNPPGHHLDAEDWDKLISEEGVIVVDTRNSYEVAYGTFKNAINPDTQSFSEITDWLKSHVDLNNKGQKIAMFCTGGIRCEKSTAYVKSLGFENVYHLNGGVLKYFQDTKGKENLWEGTLFIFDDRIALDKNLDSINQSENR
jgi:UPF0176 protein